MRHRGRADLDAQTSTVTHTREKKNKVRLNKVLLNMKKEGESFPYLGKVSLSKCMAYSGRRDGLFNSHI